MTSPSLPALIRAAQAQGRTVTVVPAGDDKAESLRLFAEVLHFPSYFGHNLDALADALEEWAHAQSDPVTLIWTGTHHLRAGDPGAARGIGAILAEIAAAYPLVRIDTTEPTRPAPPAG